MVHIVSYDCVRSYLSPSETADGIPRFDSEVPTVSRRRTPKPSGRRTLKVRRQEPVHRPSRVRVGQSLVDRSKEDS